METFVVRVWTPAEPEHEDAQPLRGLVEHVRLGEQRRFDGAADLLAFLEAAVVASTRERRPHA